MQKSVLAAIGILVFINLVSAEIIINEIMPHSNNSQTTEWVEFYNPSDEEVSLSNWKIGDLVSNDTFSLNILGKGYGIIIDGDEEDCGDLGISDESCFALVSIGRGLNDDSETIFLYNEEDSLIDSFSWNESILSEGKSWSFNGADWEKADPSLGLINPSETPDDGGDDGDGSPENNESENDEITLEIKWDEDDIVNGEEFYIEIEAFNLEDKSYDVKLWIEFEDNTSVISDRYDKVEDRWRSGVYYLTELLEGPGDDSTKVKLRIRDKYENYEGDAEIHFKIEEGYEEVEYIEILEKDGDWYEEEEVVDEDDELSGDIDDPEFLRKRAERMAEGAYSNNEITGNVIRLGKSKAVESEDIKTGDSVVYESRNQKIKKYSIYFFTLFLIIIIVLLVFERQKTLVPLKRKNLRRRKSRKKIKY